MIFQDLLDTYFRTFINILTVGIWILYWRKCIRTYNGEAKMTQNSNRNEIKKAIRHSR